MSARRKVLLIEPTAEGHHFALYLRHVLRKLIDEGCDITLLTTGIAMRHASFGLLADELRGVTVHQLPELPAAAIPRPLSLLVAQVRCWFILRRAFSSIATRQRFDVVYIPTGDWITKALELLGSPFGAVPFSILLMSPKHHRLSTGLGPAGHSDRLYDRLFRRLLRLPTLGSLLVIDEIFLEFAQREYGPLADKVKYAPDFGELHGQGDRIQCRASLGIRDGSVVVLVYGGLNLRKGIVELVEAVSDPAAPKDVVVLFAGSPAPDAAAFLDSAPVARLKDSGRALFCLHFHDDQEEYRVLNAADHVWLGYVGGFYGSSGVLHKAISAKTPVIAMNAGLVGRLTERYRLGVTVDVHSKGSIIDGLKRAVAASNDYELTPEARSFAAAHSGSRHGEVIFTALFGDVVVDDKTRAPQSELP
jgi:hypothetical protein